MDYGKIIRRAFDIVWEHKFLILLGILVALGSGGSGGGGGSSFSTSRDFNVESPSIERPEEFPEFPEMPEDFDIEGGAVAAIGAIVVVIVIFAIAVGLVFWVLSTLGRGGLIAGVHTIDLGGSSNFGSSFNAAWNRVWSLLGIGLIPAIPGILILMGGLITAIASLGAFGLFGEGAAAIPALGFGVVILPLLCILIPISLALNLLLTFANRACMIENLGVLPSYRRGWQVLIENFGEAVVLFLIQVGIQIALGFIMFLPSIFFALCCFLWPLLLIIQGAFSAYFSTVWTLAWHEWTHTPVEM